MIFIRNGLVIYGDFTLRLYEKREALPKPLLSANLLQTYFTLHTHINIQMHV